MRCICCSHLHCGYWVANQSHWATVPRRRKLGRLGVGEGRTLFSEILVTTFPIGTDERALVSVLREQGFDSPPPPTPDCIPYPGPNDPAAPKKLCPLHDPQTTLKYVWGGFPCSRTSGSIGRWMRPSKLPPLAATMSGNASRVPCYLTKRHSLRESHCHRFQAT